MSWFQTLGAGRARGSGDSNSTPLSSKPSDELAWPPSLTTSSASVEGSTPSDGKRGPGEGPGAAGGQAQAGSRIPSSASVEGSTSSDRAQAGSRICAKAAPVTYHPTLASSLRRASLPDAEEALSTDPSDSTPEAPAGELRSIGSARHEEGACSPCSFQRRNMCLLGASCKYCHLEHQKPKRLGKKNRAALRRRREAELDAELAAGELENAAGDAGEAGDRAGAGISGAPRPAQRSPLTLDDRRDRGEGPVEGERPPERGANRMLMFL